MSDNLYDLVVIGAGSGGVRAARVAASQGHKVAIIEKRHLGGTCVNVGCVPKKLFSYAAHFSEDVELAQTYGWRSELNNIDWPLLIERKNKEIERLNGIYNGLLERNGVELFLGHGRIEAADTVVVEAESGQQKLNTKRILIATGGTPFVPEFPGAEHTLVSDDIFYIPELPKRLAVVGGGYIAVEFASIFNALGVETHLIYRGKQVLKNFDHDLSEAAQTEYQAKGLKLLLETNIDSIEKTGEGLLLKLTTGDTLEVDQVLMATGRVPNLENLGLENIGLQTERGFIPVDERFETAVKGVFALGDVRPGLALTPVAIAEAMVFVDQQFNNSKRTMDYNNIATAVFSMPNLGTVGLTEAQAQQQYGDVDVYKSSFATLKQSFAQEKEKSFMKIIVDPASDRVLGMHLMSADAGEIVQGFAAAFKAGLTKAQLDSTVGIHPTLAEEFVTMREVSPKRQLTKTG